MDPVQIEHQARLLRPGHVPGDQRQPAGGDAGQPWQPDLRADGRRRAAVRRREPGTTIAFNPWLMAERRVRIGLRTTSATWTGFACCRISTRSTSTYLPSRPLSRIRIRREQSVSLADNGNGYNGGNGYRPLDNGGITPVAGTNPNGAIITPVQSVNGPADENSFQNLNFSPDTESQPNNLQTPPTPPPPIGSRWKKGMFQKCRTFFLRFVYKRTRWYGRKQRLKMEEFEREARK